MVLGLYVHFTFCKGQQLCRIIKIHGELVIVIFHFPESRQVSILMILGLMEITGTRPKPSVCCRGCSQAFSPPPQKKLTPIWEYLRLQQTSHKCYKNFKNHLKHARNPLSPHPKSVSRGISKKDPSHSFLWPAKSGPIGSYGKYWNSMDEICLFNKSCLRAHF